MVHGVLGRVAGFFRAFLAGGSAFQRLWSVPRLAFGPDEVGEGAALWLLPAVPIAAETALAAFSAMVDAAAATSRPKLEPWI